MRTVPINSAHSTAGAFSDQPDVADAHPSNGQCAKLRRKDLHDFPLEIQFEPLGGHDLEVDSFHRHFIQLNIADDGARGVEAVDLGPDLAAVLAQEAQQVLQVQNVLLPEAPQQVADFVRRTARQLHAFFQIHGAPPVALEYDALRAWFCGRIALGIAEADKEDHFGDDPSFNLGGQRLLLPAGEDIDDRHDE